MNDLQIEYFLAAAENLSFTKTANEKYVSQPAVSKQISAMEEELGVELFARGYKCTKLTPAGQMFADYFRKQREDLKILTRQARDNHQNEILTLKIGCGSGWTMDDFFAESKKKMLEQDDKLHLHLESYAFHQIVTALHENEIDIGITLESSITPMPTLEMLRFAKVQQGILFSRNHPFAGREDLVPYDFKNEIFFVPGTDRTSFIVDLVNGFCEPYNFTPRIQLVRNTEALKLNVLNGFGVAITDYWTYQADGSRYLYLPLESTHTIVAAWRCNNANPAIPLLVNELQNKFSI